MDFTCFSYRNIQIRSRPWCYVVRKQRLVWEYCAIPRCNSMCMCIPALKSVKTNKPQRMLHDCSKLSLLVVPALPLPTPTDPSPGIFSTWLNSPFSSFMPINLFFMHQFHSWHAESAPGENWWRLWVERSPPWNPTRGLPPYFGAAKPRRRCSSVEGVWSHPAGSSQLPIASLRGRKWGHPQYPQMIAKSPLLSWSRPVVGKPIGWGATMSSKI